MIFVARHTRRHNQYDILLADLFFSKWQTEFLSSHFPGLSLPSGPKPRPSTAGLPFESRILPRSIEWCQIERWALIGHRVKRFGDYSSPLQYADDSQERPA